MATRPLSRLTPHEATQIALAIRLGSDVILYQPTRVTSGTIQVSPKDAKRHPLVKQQLKPIKLEL